MNELNVSSFLTLLSRRWLVILIVFAIGLLVMPFAVKQIPTYKGKAELLIVSPALKDTTESDPDLPSIVTSTEVLDRVISRLKLHTDPAALAKRIKTKLPAKSSILELVYKDTDRNQAVRVTNAIAEESSAYFGDVSTRGYSNVLSALNKRIEESRGRIAAADKRLQLASARNAFASSDKALDDLTSRINDLQVQREQVASSLAADEATAASLQQQLHDISPIVRGEILQKDAVSQQLQGGLAKDVAALVSERSTFKATYPGLAFLTKRVGRERKQIDAAEAVAVRNGAGISSSFTQTVLDGQRAEGQVNADRERLRSIDEQLTTEQDHLQQVAGAGAVVGTLRAERDAALGQYLALSQRVSAAQGDAAQAASLGTLVVISRAIPGPSSMGLWLAAISVLLFLVAFAAAFGVDALDRRLWGAHEIATTYKRPVLVDFGEAM